MQLTVTVQTEEEAPPPKVEVKYVPPYGSLEWIQHCCETDGALPTPIDVSITGSRKYPCPELKWYNFDVYPHKIKMTNTGYTVLIGAKWKTERPYLEGGPFLTKHVLSQIHFHWGANMMEGSEHTVDKRRYPGEMQVCYFVTSLYKSHYWDRLSYIKHMRSIGRNSTTLVSADWCVETVAIVTGTNGLTCLSRILERKLCLVHHGLTMAKVVLFLISKPELMNYYATELLLQVTFFKSEYLNQEEAILHDDGVVMVCYMIKYGVNPDDRLSWVLEGFPRIREAKTCTRIGPYPMSRLLPMFHEDFFLYWGTLQNVKGESFVMRWIVPRATLFASYEQMKEFRKLWNPWDEPNLGHCRPLQEGLGRNIFFISPHWSQHNSLFPIPRVPEPSISVLSPAYQANLWMLPPQNAYMLPEPEPEEETKPENPDET